MLGDTVFEYLTALAADLSTLGIRAGTAALTRLEPFMKAEFEKNVQQRRDEVANLIQEMETETGTGEPVEKHHRAAKKLREVQKAKLRRQNRTYGDQKPYSWLAENRFTNQLALLISKYDAPPPPTPPEPIRGKGRQQARQVQTEEYKDLLRTWEKIFADANKNKIAALTYVGLMESDEERDAYLEMVTHDQFVKFLLEALEQAKKAAHWGKTKAPVVKSDAIDIGKKLDSKGGKLLQNLNNWLDQQGVK